MIWTRKKSAIAISAGVLLAAVITALIFLVPSRTMRTIQSDWTVIRGSDGQWDCGGHKIAAYSTSGETILASSKKYGDVTFSAVAGSRDWDASLAVRLQDANNGYFIIYAPPYTRVNPNGYLRLDKRVNGRNTLLAVYRKKKVVAAGRSARITVVAKGPLIKVYLNGDKLLEAADTTFTNGYLGFRIFGGGSVYPGSATYSGVRIK